ncbi:14435_t:CDS:2, partial [Gigaspora margarita]
DIMKESFAKRILSQALLISKFFRSHVANSALENEIRINNIAGGGIKRYVATRWSSYYDMIYSILRLRVVFILEHNPEIISNDKVYLILNRGAFYNDLLFITTILRPIKESIIQLKSRDSTLADCYVHLIKLATMIYRIPQDQH